MAHFKRRRPKTSPRHHRTRWDNNPRWWDVIFHTRPNRRAKRALEREIIKGADDENVAWPLQHKPHNYYW